MLHAGRSSGRLHRPPQCTWRAKTVFVNSSSWWQNWLYKELWIYGKVWKQPLQNKKREKEVHGAGVDICSEANVLTQIFLPEAMNTAAVKVFGSHGTLFSSSKMLFPPYQSCSLLHCSYSSLQRWQMQWRQLQNTSVTKSSNASLSEALCSYSTESNPDFHNECFWQNTEFLFKAARLCLFTWANRIIPSWWRSF